MSSAFKRTSWKRTNLCVHENEVGETVAIEKKPSNMIETYEMPEFTFNFCWKGTDRVNVYYVTCRPTLWKLSGCWFWKNSLWSRPIRYSTRLQNVVSFYYYFKHDSLRFVQNSFRVCKKIHGTTVHMFLQTTKSASTVRTMGLHWRTVETSDATHAYDVFHLSRTRSCK